VQVCNGKGTGYDKCSGCQDAGGSAGAGAGASGAGAGASGAGAGASGAGAGGVAGAGASGAGAGGVAGESASAGTGGAGGAGEGGKAQGGAGQAGKVGGSAGAGGKSDAGGAAGQGGDAAGAAGAGGDPGVAGAGGSAGAAGGACASTEIEPNELESMATPITSLDCSGDSKTVCGSYYSADTDFFTFPTRTCAGQMTASIALSPEVSSDNMPELVIGVLCADGSPPKAVTCSVGAAPSPLGNMPVYKACITRKSSLTITYDCGADLDAMGAILLMGNGTINAGPDPETYVITYTHSPPSP
jgi:hypothetical protein